MHFARTSALFVLISSALGAAFLSLQTGPLQPAPYGNTQSYAQQLVHMVAVDGPRQTAETLSSKNRWAELRLAVSSGQPETARLLPALVPLADPTTTHTLQQTMRLTLATHPAPILAAITEENTPALNTATICNPAGMSAAWRSHAQLAISSVHDGQLAVHAKHCLDTLEGKSPAS